VPFAVKLNLDWLAREEIGDSQHLSAYGLQSDLGGQQAVRVDQLEPGAGPQRVPLVHIPVDQHGALGGVQSRRMRATLEPIKAIAERAG
jgi:hypothetical protein